MVLWPTRKLSRKLYGPVSARLSKLCPASKLIARYELQICTGACFWLAEPAASPFMTALCSQTASWLCIAFHLGQRSALG